MSHARIVPTTSSLAEDSLSLVEAANLLNEGLDYLTRLLDAGVLPFSGARDVCRVPPAALLAFKAEREATRRTHLRELARLSQEAGMDDRDYRALLPDADLR